jgi:hypothetical protein
MDEKIEARDGLYRIAVYCLTDGKWQMVKGKW